MAEGDYLRYVAAVDVGTTTIRCHIYDKLGTIVGQAKHQTKLLFPRPGLVEIDPDYLWDAFVNVVRQAIQAAGIKCSQLACIGIATLRATFTTWDRESGKHFHNFIVWNDLRADQLVRSWNSSLSMKSLRCGAKLLHGLTGKRRYLAASVLTLANKQVIMRLLWALNNVDDLRRRADEGKVMFGTIDTWILWKLTGGREHATDYSNASSTALYDPFLLEWGTWAFKMFSIPANMMPQVKDTSGNFGVCEEDIFGSAVPIMSLVGDQQAAMFGQCCFDVGDVKCTLGTGSFLNVNTGSRPHASITGLYPLIGWKLNGSDVVYLAEGSSNDMGTAVNWLQSVGLLDNPAESCSLAISVSDSAGVYFVPGFGGLQAPINDDGACAGIIGLRPNTSRAQVIRAVLESLVYRIKQLHQVMVDEIDGKLNYIKCDGGVSTNDFVIQEISDFTGQSVDRSEHAADMTCLGVAFLAGLHAGVWNSQDELKTLRRSERIFEPRTLTQSQQESFTGWQKAIQRFLNWYV